MFSRTLCLKVSGEGTGLIQWRFKIVIRVGVNDKLHGEGILPLPPALFWGEENILMKPFCMER